MPPDRAIRITGGRWPLWVMIRPCVEQYDRLIYAGKGDAPNGDFRIQLLQYEPADVLLSNNHCCTSIAPQDLASDVLPVKVAGKNYAIAVGGTTPNPAGLTSNRNDLYATGTGGFVGLFNGADQTTLANWQTATARTNGRSLA